MLKIRLRRIKKIKLNNKEKDRLKNKLVKGDK